MAFFEKKEEISRVTPGFEETEQRTPKVGYILLLAMFVAALFFGWRAISDLQDVPTKPEQLSSCAGPFLNYKYTWEDYGRYGYGRPRVVSYTPADIDLDPQEETGCVFSYLEKKYGIDRVFAERKPLIVKRNALQTGLAQTKRSLRDQEQKYNLGLQEKQAKEEKPLFPTPVTQEQITSLRAQQSRLQNEFNALDLQIKPLDERLRQLYQDMMPDYRKAWRWYEFKVFLLEAIFVFPFFGFVFWIYRKLFAKNSPYTIIFTALVGMASVLVLRILLVWMWTLFLARIIQTIWEFIQNFALLKSVVFYSGMVLSIVIFGGAVYLLQKRIFDPRRVAIRRLREKQCPNCQTSLDVAVDFCPNCGRKLKETCAKCGKSVRRIISAPAIMFKGSGWYITDYSDKMKPPTGETTKPTPTATTTAPAESSATPAAASSSTPAASSAPPASGGTTSSSTPSASSAPASSTTSGQK